MSEKGRGLQYRKSPKVRNQPKTTDCKWQKESVEPWRCSIYSPVVK